MSRPVDRAAELAKWRAEVERIEGLLAKLDREDKQLRRFPPIGVAVALPTAFFSLLAAGLVLFVFVAIWATGLYLVRIHQDERRYHLKRARGEVARLSSDVAAAAGDG